VFVDPQGLARAVGDAIKWLLLAFEPQAEVALGFAQVFASLGENAVRAELNALAAFDALGFAAVDPVFAQRVPEAGRSGHRLPGLPGGRGRESDYFFRLCHFKYRFSFDVFRFA
jgi:hypothetical protein